jgi:hypothetical protein
MTMFDSFEENGARRFAAASAAGCGPSVWAAAMVADPQFRAGALHCSPVPVSLLRAPRADALP